MRRVASIAAFGLLVLLTMPAWAQHGGGHGGGGHFGGSFGGAHAGFSGGHFGGGGFRGSHSGPGVSRSFSPSARFGTRPGFGHGPYLHNGFRRPRFHTFGFRNNCFGFRCRGFYGYGYPWGYAGYYDPYWWWDDDSSYDNDYQQDLATAAQMNADSLAEQQMLRQEQADADQDTYARSRSVPAGNGAGSSEAKQGSPIVPATVLVFRDEHKQEVQNYAIVGPTLWNFAPQHTQKIPLSELDLGATIKVNDDNGVTFRIPGANGQ